jgi:hypothetical protein
MMTKAAGSPSKSLSKSGSISFAFLDFDTDPDFDLDGMPKLELLEDIASAPAGSGDVEKSACHPARGARTLSRDNTKEEKRKASQRLA